ncbi:MAG TPA: FAD-dependent oxidoreductase, partial [Bacteroidales bacterium]|nr:FAD-dependent oxidoreductase [Bacteroidales bacterium]
MTESVLKKDALSLWLDNKDLKSFPKVAKKEKCDVLVVGGGITGITAAYLLAKENVDVILIDALEFMSLTTGNTTAKVTFQHDLLYRHILDKYDVETARLYYQAQVEAMDMIEKLVHDHDIQCDMRKTYAMLYATDQNGISKLRKELEAYEKIGIQGEMVENISYDLPGKSGLKVDNQLEFDPVKYLSHLIDELENMGIRMIEHSRAVELDEEDGMKNVKLQNGDVITANRVVVATGFPFYDGSGQYFLRLAPY